MPTITIQPARLADSENLPLSSMESEPRSSSESTAIEKTSHHSDEEALLTPSQPNQKGDQHTPSGSRLKLVLWMLANTLATIGIVRRKLFDLPLEIGNCILTRPQVFTNKSLFSAALFKHAQLTFASYHFFMTATTLYLLSHPRIGLFDPKPAKILEMLPLAGAMCLNVILQNFSLAYSSIPFYQICRVLLTPTVAAINFFLYQKTLPRTAVFALVPICVGVGMATYFDAVAHSGDDSRKKTSLLGVVFAFSGVICSSIYTVWVALYHAKFSMNSMQLLSNQAPIGSAMLLYVIPWTDSFPVLHEVPLNGWMLVLLVSFTFEKILSMKSADDGTERALRMRDQYIPILHHQRGWRCEQHCSRARQDRLHRHAWLDCRW